MSDPTPASSTSGPAPDEKTYYDSCHCGQVTYSVFLPSDPTKFQLHKCNCTVCHKKGYLGINPSNAFKSFKLLTPAPSAGATEQEKAEEIEKILGDYSYGAKIMHHRFCRNCGTNVYAYGWIEAAGGDLVMINAVTLDDVDFSGPHGKPKKYWDGRAEKWSNGPADKPISPGVW